jgi:hypothetical protein
MPLTAVEPAWLLALPARRSAYPAAAPDWPADRAPGGQVSRETVPDRRPLKTGVCSRRPIGLPRADREPGGPVSRETVPGGLLALAYRAVAADASRPHRGPPAAPGSPGARELWRDARLVTSAGPIRAGVTVRPETGF